MELPIALFFGFIGTAMGAGILGLLRDPQVPEAMFIAGIFVLVISVLTDTVDVGDPLVNSTATVNGTTSFTYVANSIPFTQMIQVLFALIGAIMMLTGVMVSRGIE